MKTETVSFKEVGTRYRDFVVTRVTPLPELRCDLIQLVHEPTGAEVMQIANDDDENLFSLSFKTHPQTSNGVAHILEHTVLCGSEKFPVKDPFFSMIRRSLNTFMNAMTFADFTCYPASTQVKKDFYNLLSVYLDAVLHPKLHPLSFKQEGHRLEFTEEGNVESPLQYGGIVFNEMKGALTTPESRLWEELNSDLFPDLTYGINSGGDPRVIPDLTYEELLEFHRTYYHPSRCLFFFYGNLPLDGHLDFILENALEGVEAIPAVPALPHQPRRSQPVRRTCFYPIAESDDPKEKTITAFGYLTTAISEQKELLALHLVDALLMETDASPLKKALLRSEICRQASSYIDADISEVPIIFLLKGCEAGSSDELEKLLRTELEKVVAEGFSSDRIESAIHQLEFQRSEISGDGYPFGLILFMRSAMIRQHGVDPENGLAIHSLFAELREAVKDPTYLTGLIQKHLLDNQHMVRIEMQPDSKLSEKEKAEEVERLANIKARLSKKELQEIVEGSKELERFQSEQEEQDINVLPKVSLDDVPPEAKHYALSEEKIGDVTLYHHETFTNQIAYLDLVFDLPQIHEKDFALSRLFTSFLTQVGSGGRTYEENLEYIEAHTGGIGSAGSLHTQAHNPDNYNPSFTIRGKALEHKLDKLCPLLLDTLKSADFRDTTRIGELLNKQWSGLRSSLASRAMRYAASAASRSLSSGAWLGYHSGGLGYYESMKEIVERFEKDPSWLIDELMRMQTHLLQTSRPTLVLTCDAETRTSLVENGFYGLADLKNSPATSWQPSYELPHVDNEGCLIAAPVAFTAKAMRTVPYVHQDSANLALASYIADNKTLHPKIREQGGAYGGGSSASCLSGTFSFHAYRDPNLVSSLDAFQESIQGLTEGNFSADDLEEAKLEALQKLDSPMSPGSRGISAYSWMREGRSEAVRQGLRDRLLNATKNGVVAAVKEHIAPQMESAPVVTLTGRELIDKENSILVERGSKPLSVRELP